ncbi:hypothetical protein B0H16DRAFT_1714569 [Mycena metata]|uniref:Uncharacterized protein n=1 Tax=Mycena metata TaxID=1033252 RepID=A0AAD7JX85_9AGAR|nr:hypothetical protein B0H16DRAFT_1714569 [Mycena metata]
MHPSLNLKNLELLPISVRRFATPAANGSIVDLDRLLKLLDGADAPKSKNSLPVFYVDLDPSGIPTGEDLATDTVMLAILALKGLRAITDRDPETPAWSDLWPRIWAWIAFFDHFRESLAPPYTKPDLYLDLLLFVMSLRRIPQVQPSVDQTPGLRTLVMSAWRFHIESASGMHGINSLWNLHHVLNGIPFKTPTDFAEIIAGSGGLQGLASLIVDSVKRIVQFIRQLDVRSKELLYLPFIFGGVVGALTSAACAIDRWDPHDTLLRLLQVLRGLLGSHRTMREALRAGLLRVIANTIILKPHADGEFDIFQASGLQEILKRTLPGSTVYRSILAELEIRLQDIAPVIANPLFTDSDDFPAWSAFVNLAHDRIAFMKALEGSGTLKACDNLESAFSAVLFEKECQKVDWKSGGHRDACSLERASKLTNTANLGARNYAFLRALLHRDLTEGKYRESPRLLDPDRLSFMRQNARAHPSHPLATAMNYTDGHPATMWVADAYWEREEDLEQQARWDRHIDRVARSAGRMELHVMVIQDGRRARRLIFPQRSDRRSFHTGLLEVLGKPEESSRPQEIQRLLVSSESVLKIH